jgi:hypothetical protein
MGIKKLPTASNAAGSKNTKASVYAGRTVFSAAPLINTAIAV